MFDQTNIIFSIVPRLPPAIDGVGDYALNLAHRLRVDCDMDTHFWIGDPTWPGTEQLEGFQTIRLATRSTEALLKQLPQTHLILLHYVGYGYGKRGCPGWLVDGLAAWKEKNPETRLVTMFHEVAASGSLWSSAFWLSGLQHHLAKRLVLMSDRILTSKRSYAEMLQRYAPNRFDTIPTLPVFSTVGEPKNPSSLSNRTRRLIIFGGRSKRSRVYKDTLEQLHQVCRYLNIQQIFDIGPHLDFLPADIDTVPITAAGCLPSEEVSEILSDAIAGFFSYHPAFLGKSTIFAAYCAHGVIPISANMTDLPEEGLQPGKHYALPVQYNTEKTDMALMQAIADSAYTWYQTHSLSEQTRIFYSAIVQDE